MRDGQFGTLVPVAATEAGNPWDDLPASRIARLAWFELAAAATRRALVQEALAAQQGEAD